MVFSTAALRKKIERGAPKRFDLNDEWLEALGHYHTGACSTQLALELRAVKRRLLRRLGFLRAVGDRKVFHMPGRQRNLILVTSTRAGEGKTFSAVNLALSLAMEDQIETLLVDADVPRPKVRSRLGLPSGLGLTDCLLNPALNVSSLCYRANQAPLTVLPEGSPADRATELFATDASQRLWSALSSANRDRLVIMDAPPVLATTEAVVLAKYADEIVFVVEANATPEPAVAAAVDELLDVNPNVSLVLNRCLIGSGGSHYKSYEYYDRGTDAPPRRRCRRAQNRGAFIMARKWLNRYTRQGLRRALFAGASAGVLASAALAQVGNPSAPLSLSTDYLGYAVSVSPRVTASDNIGLVSGDRGEDDVILFDDVHCGRDHLDAAGNGDRTRRFGFFIFD